MSFDLRLETNTPETAPENKDPRIITLGGKKVRVLGIRRLTPTECARLQTIPDDYNWDGMSDSARYRALGNGWTVEVIKWLFSYLPRDWFSDPSLCRRPD